MHKLHKRFQIPLKTIIKRIHEDHQPHQEFMKSTSRLVVGSEPNMSAEEMWFTSYRKNKSIKSEFLFYRNPIVFFSISHKLVSVVPSGLKCGTRIFYVQKLYLQGHVFVNTWIVPFPSR